MSWINGRNLNSYGNTVKNLFISYQYNVDGIRTLKLIKVTRLQSLLFDILTHLVYAIIFVQGDFSKVSVKDKDSGDYEYGKKK